MRVAAQKCPQAQEYIASLLRCVEYRVMWRKVAQETLGGHCPAMTVTAFPDTQWRGFIGTYVMWCGAGVTRLTLEARLHCLALHACIKLLHDRHCTLPTFQWSNGASLPAIVIQVSSKGCSKQGAQAWNATRQTGETTAQVQCRAVTTLD